MTLFSYVLSRIVTGTRDSRRDNIVTGGRAERVDLSDRGFLSDHGVSKFSVGSGSRWSSELGEGRSISTTTTTESSA